MLSSYTCFLRGLLLLIAVVFFARMVGAAQAAPLATTSDCTFTPTQGGSATLIHAQIDQWFSSAVVSVGFAVPKPVGELQGAHRAADDPQALQPLTPPLATMQPRNGHAEATFRVPTNLSAGKQLPGRSLYLVCMVNGQIMMGDGAGPALFTLTPSRLPVTGLSLVPVWLPFAMSGIILLIAGGRLKRRSRCGCGGISPAPGEP